MNSKTNPNATPLRNKDLSQPRQWPGQKYWILLITTIILLVSFTASFFVLLLTDTSGRTPSGSSNASNWVGTNLNNNIITEKSTSSSSSNKDPVVPTVPSMTNYISTPSQFVNNLDVFVESNNTILVEIGSDSCTSIAEKNADMVVYPASMTKVMTLVVACENATNLNKKLTVTQEAINYKREHGGSGLLVDSSLGDAFTVQDLLYILSYDSDTIACLLIAKEIAGSEAAFVDLMNAKARELGLTSTHFSNSTGLHSEDHYTTCREMAAIMTYALDNPLAQQILLSTETKAFIAYKGNTNEKSVTYYGAPDWYQKEEGTRFKGANALETVTIKGGKTGYTEEAGVCLVTYAESKSNTGKKYINVIVGKPAGSGLTESKSTDEVKKIYNTYAE
ncbi:MAG: D-alanyl-D-alanine carboxypeptidase [Clostridia bacterium]|nr:D-alanyl-D-alanine carboxypeptidase [Clostridia bacterium]